VFKVKSKNIYGVESLPVETTVTVLAPWYLTWWAYAGYGILFLLLMAGVVQAYTYRLKQKNIRLEKIIAERTREIREKKDEIEKQRDMIEEAHEEIKSSIAYAQRIQTALLPQNELEHAVVKDYFILFRPKDVVSGDFYWENKIGDEIIIIAADCTGHGVPGAFMSMLGVTFLNDIIVGEGITDPGDVLDKLRTKIIESLKQSFDSPLRDGMDIAVINLNYKTGKIRFAGANNPLFLIRNGELTEIKGDKMPVALHEHMLEFESREIELSKDDKLYIFSDGFVDQFGGPKGKKFMKKRFKETLLKIYELPMQRQREELNRVFEEWKGENEQLDDVLVIGIKI
jgi:serine phosphatase RsbU (regulator of sigma subunit)